MVYVRGIRKAKCTASPAVAAASTEENPSKTGTFEESSTGSRYDRCIVIPAPSVPTNGGLFIYNTVKIKKVMIKSIFVWHFVY